MDIVTQILRLFINQVTPVLLLVALGYGLMRRSRLEIQTLNRLNLYVFIPGIIVSRMLRYDFSPRTSLQLLGTYLTHTIILVLCGLAVTSLLNYRRAEKSAVTLAGGWGNVGNFGLPLIELSLGAAAVVYQILIVTLNALTLFTIGLGLVAMGRLSFKNAVRNIAKQPVLHALAFVLVMKLLGWQLPAYLAAPVDYLGDGMIPIAIITLGAQLAATRAGKCERNGVGTAIVLRLIGAPLLMFFLIKVFALTGLVAKVLLIGSSVPVAVNTAIIAIEYDSEPSLAARAVLWSTLLCGLTISVVIYLAERLF